MLQRLKDEDVPAVVALMNSAYRGRGGWTSESAILSGDRISEAMLRDDLAARPAAVLLTWADDAGSLVGCVRLEALGDGVWLLGSFAVDPARQDGGIGRAMLQAAEDWIAARGGQRVRMTVIEGRDTLIGWYGRRGYRPTGETEPFPTGDTRFGTPLRPDLRFVVLEKSLDAVTTTPPRPQDRQA